MNVPLQLLLIMILIHTYKDVLNSIHTSLINKKKLVQSIWTCIYLFRPQALNIYLIGYEILYDDLWCIDLVNVL